MPHHTHILHECARYDILVEIEFHIEPASGDGWNEPREPAAAIIDSGQLVKVWHGRVGLPAETLGEVPAWLLDVLTEDDNLTSELMDEGCPDELDADDMPGGRDYEYSPDL